MKALALCLTFAAAFAVFAEDASPKPREVIIVFKTHYDLGYTDLASKVIENYRTTMIDKALDVCDANQTLPESQRFVWTIPGWPMAKMVDESQLPERRSRVMTALKRGDLVVHALPFTLHTESLDLEELARALGFASRIVRTAGLELPRDAKMTDVPSHSWVIPTLLKHAGVDFMHIGCNGASSSPELPRLFWWEGPDGSRVLTMYSPEYGSDLVPPKDWPYATWLALTHTGDNQGPPKPEKVRELLDRAQRELPGAKVRMGRMSDFADAVLAEKADIPVIRADLPDTWIHGVMSMPIESGVARRIRPSIGTVELLDTLMTVWGAKRPAEELPVDEWYEHSLLFGEHTWGMDVKRFDPRAYGDAWKERRTKGDYTLLEQSWAEKGAHILGVRDSVESALTARMKSLAESVDVDGPRVVVFNPLPWPRTGLVDIKDQKEGPFVAKDVPPTGYRTFKAKDVRKARHTSGSRLKIDDTDHTMSNEYFRVRLDVAHGCIASLTDIATGRELVNPRSTYGFGQYLYERFSKQNVDEYLKAYPKVQASWVDGDFGKPGLPSADEAPYRAASPAKWAIEMRRDDVSVSARMHAAPTDTLPHEVTIEVILYGGLPYLDVAWSIDNKPPDSWPEAGWLCFPLNLPEPRFRLGRLGGIVDPAKDNVRGANHDVFCLNSGMAVFGQDSAGIGICPMDSPIVSLGRPGLWHYSKDYVATDASVFVNLYNNQWSTNFQQWSWGSWTSRVRLWIVPQEEADGRWVAKAWEARMPLLASYADGDGGDLPAMQPGLQLSREGVLVTAYGKNPDGEGTVLRLWEQCGVGGSCEVKLPSSSHTSVAKCCDLRGQSQGGPLSVKKGSFAVDVPRYAPVSLLLETP